MRTFNLKKFALALSGIVVAGAAYDVLLHGEVLWGLYVLAGIIAGGCVAFSSREKAPDA